MKRIFIVVLVSIVFSNSFAQDYSSYYQSINK
jgi:hypothetical protein